MSRFAGNFVNPECVQTDMANQFYSPDEQRASRVNALFSRIAGRYDLINDLQSFGLHRLWKRRVVRLAQVQNGEKALDLCCGTGDLAFGLARDGAQVTGLDFTQAMLDVAESRSRSLAIPQRVTFVQGDAQKVPFADESFQIVTVGYGLRNLSSWETGLNEMLRVASPGGRLLVLEFGKPENALWRWVYFAYLRMFVPLLGWLFCGSAAAYAYILESLNHYPGQRGVAEKMRELGLCEVKVINLLGGIMSINYGEKR
jgi:demethylmenaquinone methyltransferase / 2-methoxy-6-polyprenyl-1,4-benzoquinol methylase